MVLLRYTKYKLIDVNKYINTLYCIILKYVDLTLKVILIAARNDLRLVHPLRSAADSRAFFAK